MRGMGMREWSTRGVGKDEHDEYDEDDEDDE